MGSQLLSIVAGNTMLSSVNVNVKTMISLTFASLFKATSVNEERQSDDDSINSFLDVKCLHEPNLILHQTGRP